MEINIEGLVKERIEDMDLQFMVKEVIGGLITKDIRETIGKIVKDECSKLISDGIAELLSGAVETDDGWGETQKFPSLEIMFKGELKKQMDSTWDAKREIEKQLSNRVKSIMDSQYKDVVTKIVDGLTGSYIKKEK